MTPPTPRPLPTDYKKLCPQFDRSHAEEMAHWAKDPTLVQGMFYAFIFQDALRFGIYGEDVIADLAEAIKNYRWVEFEARLDVHHASLVQHREFEATDSSVKIAPCAGGAMIS